MKERLERTYVELQSLDMKPTLPNITILYNALDVIKDCFKKIAEIEEKEQAEKEEQPKKSGGK